MTTDVKSSDLRVTGVLVPLGIVSALLLAFSGFVWNVINNNIDTVSNNVKTNIVKIDKQMEMFVDQNKTIIAMQRSIDSTLWEMKVNREKVEDHVKNDVIQSKRDVKDAMQP